MDQKNPNPGQSNKGNLKDGGLTFGEFLESWTERGEDICKVVPPATGRSYARLARELLDAGCQDLFDPKRVNQKHSGPRSSLGY